jgi:hypothetical protein
MQKKYHLHQNQASDYEPSGAARSRLIKF